jgi:hypothetical protein
MATQRDRLITATRDYQTLLTGFIDQLVKFQETCRGVGPVEVEVMSLRVILARVRNGIAAPEPGD